MFNNKRWNIIFGVFLVLVVVLGVTSVLTAAPKTQDTDHPDNVYLPFISNDTSSGDDSSQFPPTDVSENIMQEDLGNGWILYTDHELGFSIEYPDDWYVLNQPGMRREFERTCFGSPNAKHIETAPNICVTFKFKLEVKSGKWVSSDSQEAMEHISNIRSGIVQSSSLSISREQFVANTADVAGLSSIELHSQTRENDPGTEPSYGSLIYVDHPSRGLVKVSMGGGFAHEFQEEESTMRQILHTLVIFNE